MKDISNIPTQHQFHSILHILKYSITLLVLSGAMMIVFFLLMGRLKLLTLKLEGLQNQLQNIEQKLSIQEPQKEVSSQGNHESAGFPLICGNDILEIGEECDGQSYSCEQGSSCDHSNCLCRKDTIVDNGIQGKCGDASNQQYKKNQEPPQETLCADGVPTSYKRNEENQIWTWICNGNNGTQDFCFTP